MTHDNKTYPLKGMKTSRLPELARGKDEYSLEKLQKAKQMIEDQANKMGLLKASEGQTWP